MSKNVNNDVSKDSPIKVPALNPVVPREVSPSSTILFHLQRQTVQVSEGTNETN